MKENQWDTSVDELMRFFQEAIERVVPALRKARIHIGTDSCAEAWDDISESLFHHIVVQAIENGLFQSDGDSVNIPIYEMDYDHYKDMSFILVEFKEESRISDRVYAFHSFQIPNRNDDLPLKKVLCRALDSRGNPKDAKLHSFGIDEVVFRCSLKVKNSRREVSKLRIRL